jgi:hypothetical protein
MTERFRRFQRVTWRRSTIAALGLAVVGIVSVSVGIGWLVIGFNDIPHRIDARPNVPVPGDSTLRLSQGQRGIWLEVTAPSRPDLADVGVTITPAAGGAPLPIRFPTGLENYDLKGRRGALIGTVLIPVTSDYRVEVDGRGGDNVSIGATTATEDLIDTAPAFTAFGIGVLGFFAAVLVTLVAASRRRRSGPQPADGP